MAPSLPSPPDLPDRPPWLSDRRRGLTDLIGETPWPSDDEEVWRYSPIDRFVPPPAIAARPSSTLPAGARSMLDGLVDHAGVVVVVDGHVVHGRLDDTLAAKGVVFERLDQADDGASHLPPSGGRPADLFALAAEAWAPEPLVLVVPDGVVVERPFVVIQWSEAAETTAYSHLVVAVGQDAEATVLEMEGAAPGPRLRSGLVDLQVAPAGRLHYLDVQDLDREATRVVTQRASVERQGSLSVMQVALGSAVARTRSDCRLIGRGATGDLLALYFGTGDQVLDFRTFQDHEAPDTTSNLLFKGAVGDHARSVYTGLIRVHPEGRGTNAFQTNRNLKLSKDAWADSVPNLEIENNEVRCSHASTVGPVDEDQRFYLESRGIPPRMADRLIVGGFFDEVLERLPVPALGPTLRDQIVARFAEVDDLAVEEVA